MNFTQPTETSRPVNLITVIGLVVAFIAYYLAPILSWFGIALGSDGPAMSIFWKVVAAVIIIGFIWLIEKRPLASVNIKRPSEKDVTWAFYFGVRL